MYACLVRSIGRIGWLNWVVKLGGNPLRLHCMLPGQIGRIGWKSIEITLYACLVESVKLGGNPLRLHCMPVWSNQSNWVVKLGGNPLRLCLVKFGGNPLRLWLVKLVEFGG